MKWVAVKSLQRDFGLSRMVSEALVTEQVRLIRKSPGRKGLVLAATQLCGFLWGLGAIGWLLPLLPHRSQLLLRLPGLALMVFSWFVLPRLLAGDAILVAAAQASQRLTGAAT